MFLQFIQDLSGVQLNDNATIISVAVAKECDFNDSTCLLITLRATEGGSEELTQELFERVNITAQEVGLLVSQPPIRFGESDTCH